MKSIYCSKLYKASPRKDKIKAAITNPINSELVTQLREYLDDEYKIKEDQAEEVAVVSPEVTEEIREAAEPSTRIVGPSGNAVNMHETEINERVKGPEDHLEDLLELDTESAPDLEDNLDPEVDAKIGNEDEEIESATSINSSIKDVKDLLNKCVDTQGVSRTSIRNNELWIYYQDSVNLNSIMSPVIECIESSELSNLQFSRLARSDNAIVFDLPMEQEPNEYI